MFDKLLTNIINNILTPLEYLIFAFAVIYFFWGIFTFIKNADNEAKRKEGISHMIWGVVGLFVMLSAKGIINLILSTLGLR